MKKLDFAKSVIYPYVLGVVALAIGIGLAIYYNGRSAVNASTFIVPILTMVVGVICIVGGIVRTCQYAVQSKIIKGGKTTTAEFINYSSGGKSGKIEYFSVEYRYCNDEGKEYVCKSPSQFTWQEVLALKAAEKFTIGYRGKNCILLDDIGLLTLAYSKKMSALQQKYEAAVDKVETLQRQYEGTIATRNKNVAMQKQEKREKEEDEKPDAADGIN
ncbi:MAG: hypothetical protein ACI4MI_04470 [Christensenellales bacterium]